MDFSVTARLYEGLPGAVRLDVLGDTSVAGQAIGKTAKLWRVDSGATEKQPVRNFSGVPDTGLKSVIDCEAPLGRSVVYQLTDWQGRILATSGPVTCPALGGGKGILRSVLRPQVGWMVVEPQDETSVEWETSTTVHRIVGSDTPVVVGEVRQRRTGTMTFLCRSIGEADQLVRLSGDGTVLLLRHDPCASAQTRDLLCYPLGITERRWGRAGWRLVSMDYQATKFVPGDTLEPPLDDWTFGDLRDSANDFSELNGIFDSFGTMALNIRNSGELR